MDNFYIETPHGEIVRTVPGNRKPGDRRILVTLPKNNHAPSLYFIGILARLHGEIEDNNYPESYHQGAEKFVDFILECVRTKKDIREILKQHQTRIPSGYLPNTDHIIQEEITEW